MNGWLVGVVLVSVLCLLALAWLASRKNETW
jgi:hypothetical protein